MSQANAQEEFDPESFLDEFSNTPVSGISDKIKQLDSLDKTNKVLEYMSQNKDTHPEAAKQLISEIFEARRGEPLQFSLSPDNTLTSMKISENNGNNILELEIDNKEFNININELPEEVTGIHATQTGLVYTISSTEEQTIEVTDPQVTITKQDDTITLDHYIGLDGEEHTLTVSAQGQSRITLKENGIIEISGGAQIYDPETQTTFSLYDRTGAAGHIQFFNEGHVIRPFEGSRIIAKKGDGLEFDVKLTNNNGVFIVGDDNVNPETYNSFPPRLNRENTILFNSQEKQVYSAQAPEIIYRITGEGYTAIGNPLTPDGGVPLDTSKTFEGANIHATSTNGGGILSGNWQPGQTQPGVGGQRVTPNNGRGGGLGGQLNSILPYLLIGGGILLAILLLSGSSGDDEESGSGGTANPPQGNDVDTNYNDGSVSTGTSVNRDPSSPQVQSPYN